MKKLFLFGLLAATLLVTAGAVALKLTPAAYWGSPAKWQT